MKLEGILALAALVARIILAIAHEVSGVGAARRVVARHRARKTPPPTA